MWTVIIFEIFFSFNAIKIGKKKLKAQLTGNECSVSHCDKHSADEQLIRNRIEHRAEQRALSWHVSGDVAI